MPHLDLTCQSEADTARLGETLALALKVGDCIHLEGDLGAGKTTLARAMIRCLAGDPGHEVPSPTFTLIQSYQTKIPGPVAHLDLYRVEDIEELEELGIEEVLLDGAVLVEWPKKGGAALPLATLHLSLTADPANDCRQVRVTGDEAALARFTRSIETRSFLDGNGHGESARAPFMGDASARTYEKIHPASGPALILMNSPAQTDGPIIRDGLPYSRIAHLAEDVGAFVADARLLADQGFRTPRIMAQDLDAGFLLIEDLGNGKIIDENRVPIDERYLAAVETLAAMHGLSWPSNSPVTEGVVHEIPPFDRRALLIEVDLLIEWYLPYRLNRAVTEEEKSRFHDIWNDLIDVALAGERSFVIRDYHSPNIIWIDDAEGADRIGIIDFQDGLIGPAAYDVASLAQDARVDVSEQLESRLVDHYCVHRGDFDEAAFRTQYAVMAAQRATKVLGIFVRLYQRDGKEGYLPHLPRIETYIRRALKHPQLAQYRAWMQRVLGVV